MSDDDKQLVPVQHGGALAITDGQSDWTSEQKAALAQIGIAAAPAPVQKAFLHECQRSGLDPWARQIYMICRGGKWQTQTAIDGFRVIAERHGQYAGQDGPYWCGEDGEWHDKWLKKTPPAAAKIGVYRHDWSHPVYAVAMFSEYTTGQNLWKTKPALMIAKCAEALALRKAFPQDLSGLYTSDEMQQADRPKIIEHEPIEVTAHVEQPPEEEAPVEKVIAKGRDWATEIEAAGRDKDKLRVLYKEATGFWKGEVTKKMYQVAALEVIDLLRLANTKLEVETIRGKITDKVDKLDVGGLLDKEERIELNYRPEDDGPLNLTALTDLVTAHLEEVGYSVAEGLQIAAQEAAAHDAAEDDVEQATR